MITRVVTLTLLILMFSSVSFGLYFIVDYFMDHGFPKAFGQACDDYIHDDCSYINSHLNTFNDFDYRGHVRCKLTLDAGQKPGATWKLKWLRFKVEATNCSDDADYLEFYDMSLHWYDRLRKRDPFMARYCGWTYPDPNLTNSLTQRYFTFIWHTNGNREDKGWRVMATRVWPEAYCPGDDYMRCKAENICMDGRLKCDGIEQCDDGSDETDCQWWEVIIGSFLAIGTAGVTAISLTLTFVYVCLFFAIKYLVKKLRGKPPDQVVRIDIDQAGPDEKKTPLGKGGVPATVKNEKETNKKDKKDDAKKDDKDKKNDKNADKKDDKDKKVDQKKDDKDKGKEAEKGTANGSVAPKATAIAAAGLVKSGADVQLPNAVTTEPDKTKAGETAKGGQKAGAADKNAETAAPGIPKTDTNGPGQKTVVVGLGGVTAAGKTDQKAGGGKDEPKTGTNGTGDQKAGTNGSADKKTDDTKLPAVKGASSGTPTATDQKTDTKNVTSPRTVAPAPDDKKIDTDKKSDALTLPPINGTDPKGAKTGGDDAKTNKKDATKGNATNNRQGSGGNKGKANNKIGPK